MENKDFKEIKSYLKFCWEKNPYLKRYPWEEWEKAYEKEKIVYSLWKGLFYFRLNKEFKSFPVGTVFNEDFLIRGYPSIPRIYVLKTGLVRYLSYPFYIEEKIEGYNVRLWKIKDKVLAFTRRGYICPFATDRWEDVLDKLPEFLERFPKLVACCEVAGPENPFVSEYPPYVKEDVQYFIFDFLKEGTGELLGEKEKIQLFKDFQFNHPEIHGPFHPERDYQKICQLIRKYHQEGREGIVCKPEKEGTRVKYVTPYSNLADLKVVFPYLGEVDPNFISLRLIRLFFNLYEFEEFKEEVYQKLGEHLFEQALNFLKKEKLSYEIFKVRFKKEENFLALLAHFKQAKVNIEILKKTWERNYLKVEFKKIYPKATQFWSHKLEGWGEVD